MTEQEKSARIEDFVRRVLTKVFHQEADAETVSNVAEKVSRSVPETETGRVKKVSSCRGHAVPA